MLFRMRFQLYLVWQDQHPDQVLITVNLVDPRRAGEGIELLTLFRKVPAKIVISADAADYASNFLESACTQFRERVAVDVLRFHKAACIKHNSTDAHAIER